MRRIALAGVLAGGTVAAPARASDADLAAQARFDARYLRLVEAEETPFEDYLVGGLALRPMTGGEHVLYAAGLDFSLGATQPAGFAYSAHFRPVGIAFADDGLRLSSTFGIGVDGVTGALDPAMRLPLDALGLLRS